MGKVLALVDDLFFQAKIMEAARQAGIELLICGAPDALIAELQKNLPRLVIVDLNAREDPIGAIERLQAGSNHVPVVAFLSHVQTELAARARTAGCRTVMPRCQFTRDLATILKQAKSESA